MKAMLMLGTSPRRFSAGASLRWVQSMLDNAVPIGDRYYWKSNFVDELDPDFARVLNEGATVMPSPHSMILRFEIKGAIKRAPKEVMAFDHRDAGFELSIIAHCSDAAKDEENMRWAREVWSASQTFVSSAVYANHLGADDGQARGPCGLRCKEAREVSKPESEGRP